MRSRAFRGIPSIQEVECWGGTLTSDVKLMGLQMYRLPESTVVASLNVYTNNCNTFDDYSSCIIFPSVTHRSKVRLLVHDLKEGESREYGCTATILKPLGIAATTRWSLRVKRNGKLKAYGCY